MGFPKRIRVSGSGLPSTPSGSSDAVKLFELGGLPLQTHLLHSAWVAAGTTLASGCHSSVPSVGASQGLETWNVLVPDTHGLHPVASPGFCGWLRKDTQSTAPAALPSVPSVASTALTQLSTQLLPVCWNLGREEAVTLLTAHH